MRAAHAARVAECLRLVVASQELIKEMAIHIEADVEVSSKPPRTPLASASSSAAVRGSRWSASVFPGWAAQRELDAKSWGAS